jgi:hypothetical protein
MNRTTWVELFYGLLDDMVPGSPHVLHRGFVTSRPAVILALLLPARIFRKEAWQRT